MHEFFMLWLYDMIIEIVSGGSWASYQHLQRGVVTQISNFQASRGRSTNAQIILPPPSSSSSFAVAKDRHRRGE